MANKNRPEEPKVCIVVLNWNGLDDTLACLSSVYQLAYSNFRVVVIDNGSAAGQAGAIREHFPKVGLIKNKENLGFTGGCNQGIDEALKAGADYVVLLNNDTIVTEDFLSKVVDFYEKTPDAGMVSPVILYTDRKRLWFAGAKVTLGIIRHLYKGKTADDAEIPKEPFKTGYVPGTALLISTELIKKIGSLDDRYFAYYEDLDWSWKARKLGYYPYVVPSARIYHKKSGSTSEGGHKKWNKIPAYYVARNSILLASNFTSFKKVGFILAQVFIKLPLNMILLVKPNAWGSYLRGTGRGLSMVLMGRSG